MNRTTPILQKSHSFPYGYSMMISGATYPGVPQVVLAYYSDLTNLARPKSEILREESSCVFNFRSKFSGLISLCTIFNE